MLTVGLVGCGTIGLQLALAVERTYAHRARLVALHDRDPARARALRARLRSRPPIRSLPQLIRASQLVIEAASGAIAARVARSALRADKDVLIMSVGGLLTDRTWRAQAARSRGRVWIPSGAVAGLDGIKAMAAGRIRRLTLTTSKPPRALAGAPYLIRRRISLTGLKTARTVFDGSAQAAVRAFPQNINVAAALTLASGLPAARVRVRVVADPRLRRNRHAVEVDSDCARMRCEVESAPSANPKTSELAARSAIATLRRIVDPISIGT